MPSPMWRTIGSLLGRSVLLLKILRVRCEALKVMNDYSVPPALKCVERKLFLPAPDPRLPCQDYQEKQPQKTLAYAQALQYWAKRANLPCPGETCHLARCVQELRWAIKPFTIFSDHAILEKAKPDQGAPKAEVKGPKQPSFHQLCQPMSQLSQLFHQLC